MKSDSDMDGIQPVEGNRMWQMLGEHLPVFVLLGYDSEGRRVEMVHAISSRDQDAVQQFAEKFRGPVEVRVEDSGELEE